MSEQFEGGGTAVVSEQAYSDQTDFMRTGLVRKEDEGLVQTEDAVRTDGAECAVGLDDASRAESTRTEPIHNDLAYNASGQPEFVNREFAFRNSEAARADMARSEAVLATVRSEPGRIDEERSERATKIRIALFDSQQILLDALQSRLNAETGMSVVCALTDTDAGSQLVDDLQPDLVILDTDIPGKGVFDFIVEARSRNRQIKFLILTRVLSDVLLAQALQVKAVGYILKSEPINRLIEAIHQVTSGHAFYSDPVQSRISHDPVRNLSIVKTDQSAADLTPRQMEVLRHLARGASVKEVAKTMHLSQKSVDSHKYRIMNKLGIHDRVDLTRYAIREGLIEA